MSGTGRKSAYRKSVTEEVLNSFPEPDRAAGERVARVVQSRGGNILQVLLDDGQEESLALLPTKFRKLIWVKRGDHLIVSGASHDFLTAAGDKGKVRFMVEHILYKDQVKHLKAQGLWPEAFAEEEGGSHQQPPASQDQEKEEDEDSGGVEGADGGGGKAEGRIQGAEDGAAVAGNGEAGGSGSGSESEYESEDDDFSDLPVNTNRLAKMHLYQDSDEEESDEEEESEDEEEG